MGKIGLASKYGFEYGCRRKEEEREQERQKREGSSYKTKEERAREARESRQKAKGEDEAEAVDGGKFDPHKDYYKLLGIDRAAAASEVRNAYKKLALLYHPDKYKNSSDEEQAAIAEKFREVASAFDVLINEDMRVVYDKCRDYMESNPGKGLPTLTPEEAAQMRKGAGELSRLRRMGPKLRKHDSLCKDVQVSLAKLNYGCTKAVTVDRRRVDYSGKEFVSSKTFHLVIRKGSREGDTIVFEDEGEESVDTHAGDLVFTLRSKPHPLFKRRGEKDLEVFASTLPQDEIFSIVETESLSGRQFCITVCSLRESLLNGGRGGIWQHKIQSEGLYDGISPWDSPTGDLYVSTRYPPAVLQEKNIVVHVRQGSIYLIGSSDDKVPGSLTGGIILAKIKHALETRAMLDSREGEIQKMNVVVVRLLPKSQDNSPDGTVEGLKGVFNQRYDVNYHEYDIEVEDQTHIDDSTFLSMLQSDVVVLDLPVLKLYQSSHDREKYISRCRHLLDENGFMQLLWDRHMAGTDIVAIEGAASLMGPSLDQTPQYFPHPILPWYMLRCGGEGYGWDDVCHSLKTDKKDLICVGVLQGSVYAADPISGEAEMLIAPYTDALIARAAWEGPEDDTIDEAEEDFGYIAAFQKF